MITVIISGYEKMGHMVEKELKDRGIELVEASEDITSIPSEVAAQCVCIDFTTPDAFRANYPFIARHFKAAVIGTTGWYDIRADVVKTSPSRTEVISGVVPRLSATISAIVFAVPEGASNL